MPRVLMKKKSKAGKAGKAIECGKCGCKITPGMTYKTWAFRYGGKRVRCDKPKCRPRESDLTQSKMSGAYAAREAIEDAVAEFLEGTMDVEDLKDAVESGASDIEGVASEYEDSFNDMNEGLQNSETGQLVQEKADALNNWAQELRDLEFDDEDEPREDAKPEVWDNWREEKVGELRGVLENFDF